MNPTENFVKEKTREHLRQLGITNNEFLVNAISEVIIQDEQFWKLFDSLFASYIMNYTGKSFVAAKEATN